MVPLVLVCTGKYDVHWTAPNKLPVQLMAFWALDHIEKLDIGQIHNLTLATGTLAVDSGTILHDPGDQPDTDQRDNMTLTRETIWHWPEGNLTLTWGEMWHWQVGQSDTSHRDNLALATGTIWHWPEGYFETDQRHNVTRQEGHFGPGHGGNMRLARETIRLWQKGENLTLARGSFWNWLGGQSDTGQRQGQSDNG